MLPLRLIIAATPKTGNTWVKHLLGAVYDLPLRDLPVDWRELDWGEPNESWVGHQHYLPTEDFVRAALSHGVRFVTTTRHPGDTFISLLHHVRRETAASENPFDATYVRGDSSPFGPRCAEYLAKGYYQHLQLSLDWMRVPQTTLVRYESLCAEPIETLRQLTNAIAPVSEAKLRRAFCECEIDVLRRRNPTRGNFFSDGRVRGLDRTDPVRLQRNFHSRPSATRANGRARLYDGRVRSAQFFSRFAPPVALSLAAENCIRERSPCSADSDTDVF